MCYCCDTNSASLGLMAIVREPLGMGISSLATSGQMNAPTDSHPNYFHFIYLRVDLDNDKCMNVVKCVSPYAPFYVQ